MAASVNRVLRNGGIDATPLRDRADELGRQVRTLLEESGLEATIFKV
jgi:hypothetical protein